MSEEAARAMYGARGVRDASQAYRWYKSTKDDVIDAYERPVARYCADPVVTPSVK